MVSNLPPGCGSLPGEGPDAEAAEAMGEMLYEIIEKRLGPEDQIPGDIDMLVEDLMEFVGKACRESISDYQAGAAMAEEEQKAADLANRYWQEQSRDSDVAWLEHLAAEFEAGRPCKPCHKALCRIAQRLKHT